MNKPAQRDRVSDVALLAVLLIPLHCRLTWARDTYHPPRTFDGRVDMQGTWAHYNLTPLERPKDVTTHIIDAAVAARIEAQVSEFCRCRCARTGSARTRSRRCRRAEVTVFAISGARMPLP
jgi:hypothetical protein